MKIKINKQKTHKTKKKMLKQNKVKQKAHKNAVEFVLWGPSTPGHGACLKCGWYIQ